MNKQESKTFYFDLTAHEQIEFDRLWKTPIDKASDKQLDRWVYLRDKKELYLDQVRKDNLL